MEFVAPSGAKIVISPASWENSNNLRMAAKREAALFPSSASTLQLEMYLESSPVVAEILWKCLEKCTYDGQKITKDIFEKVENRQDYLPIVEACLNENARPFLETPNSKFLAFLGLIEPPSDTQKQT